MARASLLLIAALSALLPMQGSSQSATDMIALKGLAPVSALSDTPEGRAALGANYTITGSIQTGAIRQATLLPFTEQQQLALRDVFSTSGNLSQLADGLGTTLGSAYVAKAHYLDRSRFTSVSQRVADLIAYALNTSGRNSNAGKFFFANGTTDGKQSVSPEAAAILTAVHGHTDIFGANYGRPSGTAGAGAFGDSRPFQTEPSVALIVGPDYFHVPSDNNVYNHGAMMDLTNSPSYPSGHTTYGYMGALVLAIMVPERYQQMIVRGAEYGNDRIIVGAHYAMDVLGGRTLAMYDLAHLLANDPAYVGHPVGAAPAIKDFRAEIKSAGSEVRSFLESACGKSIPECSREDIGRLSDASANEAFYAGTQTYSLPVVYAKTATAPEDVSQLAPEAGYLLTAAFPSLTLEQADRILTETEGPGGGFLDNGSAFGVYSRINLYAAAGRVVAMTGSRSSNR
jgi:membrane-associated phospholipid phosphatase